MDSFFLSFVALVVIGFSSASNAHNCSRQPNELQFLFMASNNFNTFFTYSSLVGVNMALDRINSNSSLLSNFTLNYSNAVDSQVMGGARSAYDHLLRRSKYSSSSSPYYSWQCFENFEYLLTRAISLPLRLSVSPSLPLLLPLPPSLSLFSLSLPLSLSLSCMYSHSVSGLHRCLNFSLNELILALIFLLLLDQAALSLLIL